VNSLVRRHRLEATGNGKARRFPLCTVLALQERLSRGRGIQTANYYLREMKAFCSWLIQDRRTSENPLTHMKGRNGEKDKRHDRRSLSLDELRLAFQTAQESSSIYRELAGWDRAMLYTVACATGFRASELAMLCPEHFDLESEPPTATLGAEYTK